MALCYDWFYFFILMSIKGNNFFFIPIFLIWFIFKKKKIPFSKNNLILFSIGILIAVVMSGSYTYLRYGQYQITSSSGGLNFMEGKCPSKNNTDSTGQRWHSPFFVQLGEMKSHRWSRPFSDQGYFLREGLRCIAQNPWILVQNVRYIYYLFFGNTLWPDTEGLTKTLNQYHEAFYSAFIWPGILVGFLILWRRRWTMNRAPYLLALSLVLCVWFTKSEIRFRIPFDVIFIPIAVLGWKVILCSVRQHTRKIQSHSSQSTHSSPKPS